MASEAMLEEKFRSLARQLTRDSLGLVLSSALAWKLPYMTLPAGFNLASLIKHTKELKNLKKTLAEYGIRIKKRIIAKGILEGAATKFGTWVFTLGHDDFITMATKAPSFFTMVGNTLARSAIMDKLSSAMPILRSLKSFIMTDVWRTENPILHKTTEWSGKPAEAAQRLSGTYETRKLGWNAPGGDVGKQVVLVGATQVGAETAGDLLIEGSYDKARKNKTRARWWRR